MKDRYKLLEPVNKSTAALCGVKEQMNFQPGFFQVGGGGGGVAPIERRYLLPMQMGFRLQRREWERVVPESSRVSMASRSGG